MSASPEWARHNSRTALWAAGVTVAVFLLVLFITHWNPYKAQRAASNKPWSDAVRARS